MSIAPAPRYQVRPVLWGNRKRFVVRDSETDTTIAIRTTGQIADGDLMRLNMRVSHDPYPQPHSLEPDPGSVPGDVARSEPVARADRQCGRCRGHFSLDPTLDPTGLADWWLCEPCRTALFGGR